MPNRALIIVVENYASSEDSTISPLPGSVALGDDFWDWLVSKKHLDPSEISYCTDDASPYKTSGATSPEIVAAIKALRDKGKESATNQLFFYFSGHGFSYANLPDQFPAPVLVVSNFVNLDDSGDACFNLDEIRLALYNSLGPGEHYYFVDACRNPIDKERITVQNLGKRFPKSDRGRPSLKTMFSTEPGAPAAAATTGHFGKVFIAGLKGNGRAKQWDDDGQSRMYVTFDSLLRYVSKGLKSQKPYPQIEGEGSGVILEFATVPRQVCDIEVVAALPTDMFTLSVPNGKGEPQSHQFTGARYQFDTVAEDYDLSIATQGAIVQRIKPRPPEKVDLYSDCRVEFRKTRFRSGSGPPPPSAFASVPLYIIGSPARARIRIRNIQSGEKLDILPDASVQLVPGTYEAQVIEDDWVTVRTLDFTVAPAAKDATLDVSMNLTTVAQRALAAALPSYARDESTVEFSETVGRLANTDLGLWLSIVGASRVIGSHDDVTGHRFSKLSPLPFHRFDAAKRGDAPIYALVGLRFPTDQVGVGVSRGEDVAWHRAEQVPEMPGIYEYRSDTAGGPHLLSFQINERPTLTLATYGLENRATLVVVAENDLGQLKAHQFLLPLAKLRQYLPDEVRRQLLSPSLRPVKFITLAQQLFAQKRRVEPPAGSDAAHDWMDLLHGKWWDPLGGVMAAHEMVRRQSFDFRDIVMRNLATYYGELPDVAALEMLMGRSRRRPDAVPLLLDGVLAFDNYEDLLPLPASALDYGGTWTSWWGAVRRRR